MLTNMKTVGVFMVIFCCFAVLYPKIFHPMVVHIFGLTKSKTREGNELPKHPREVNPNRPMPHPPRNPTMRSGMHPGMRAAAEMRKQAGEQGGSNKGMINMVLPMYAVGIVIYLVYTMAKVFMRNKKDEPGPFQAKSDYQYKSSSYQDDAGPYFNYPTDMDDETRFLLSKREKLEELEELLAKAELKQINDNEMVTLRERLEETESQMSRILKAMEHVQTRVKDGIDAHLEGRAKKMAPDDAEPVVDEDHEETEEQEEVEPVTVRQTMTDLNALDSESSGRESDDERSDDDDDLEDEDEEDDDDDEEDDDDDDGEIEEDGITRINGIDRIDLNPTDNDVAKHLSRQYDLIPSTESDSDMRGDVMNDVDTDDDDDVEVDDVIETLGASRLMDSDDEGLRLRKTKT